MNVRRTLWMLALLGGLLLFAQGLYIPLKAWLAQVLLESAWQRTLQGQSEVRPWQSADTWPVARLRQQRLGVDQIVLSGASGRVLAFGPGHVTGSARPGSAGNLVISGHRDTHFRWLAELQDGDLLHLQLKNGRSLGYVVTGRGIHHRDEGYLLDPGAGEGLRLITCYPFDALTAGAELRYVVEASLVKKPVLM